MSAFQVAGSGAWTQRAAALWQTRPAWLGGAPAGDAIPTRSVPIHDWVGRTGQPVKVQGFDQPLLLVVMVFLLLRSCRISSWRERWPAMSVASTQTLINLCASRRSSSVHPINRSQLPEFFKI